VSLGSTQQEQGRESPADHLAGDHRRDLVVADASSWLRGPVGVDAAKHQPRNLPRRRQGCGAAVVLSVGLSQQWLPGELSLVRGSGSRELAAPFFIDQSFRNNSDGLAIFRRDPACIIALRATPQPDVRGAGDRC